MAYGSSAASFAPSKVAQARKQATDSTGIRIKGRDHNILIQATLGPYNGPAFKITLKKLFQKNYPRKISNAIDIISYNPPV